MRVLRSRGAELERDFAFGVVRQLFEPALAEASELERADLLQAAAGIAATHLAFPGARPADDRGAAEIDPSFAILHGLYWLCANLAAAGPLCLVVDDAHWADGPSLRYLAFLLTRLEELDVSLVVAARPHDAGADADLLAMLMTDPSANVIRLAPLTRAGVSAARRVEARRRPRIQRSSMPACARRTGRRSSCASWSTASSDAGVAPTAEAAHRVERIGARTVGRSVRLRLRRLPEPARRLARALAILERADLLQAARLADLGDDEAAEAAELLATAGILEPGRPLAFVHAIVRTAVYSALSATERSQGHRRAARLLAERPGAYERVAEHLARERAGRRRLGRRAAGRCRACCDTERRSGVGRGVPPPRAR